MSKQVVVAFVPVLHQGYIDFFKKYPDSVLYIFGSEINQDFTSITRDLRVIDPELTKKAIEALGIIREVKILNKDNAVSIDVIIMPDEDVSRVIADTYFKDKTIEFVSTFLRWDKQISTTEFVVPTDRIISENELDQELMSEAIKTGQRSADWWRQVGALAVKNGKILYSGFNENVPSKFYVDTFGDPRSNFDAGIRIDLVTTIHAEANIIAHAARDGQSLAGTDFFVSTFPCPTCARLIRATGVKRVYYNKGYSILDAEDILKGAGIEIILVKEK
jgi:dCMP deaminase